MYGLPAISLPDKSIINEYKFGKCDEYEVRLANTLEERKRAWRMVFRRYLAEGYAKTDGDGLWCGLYDALPQTTTVLVTRNGADIATVSLVFDSDYGLPADTLYGDELDKMRRNGRRLCEISSLASEETDRKAAVEVLNHMFKIIYLLACRLADATDFIITVNPHHVVYYERKMLFQRIGEVRSYGKVNGAPAVLLQFDLETAFDRWIARYAGTNDSCGRHYVEPQTWNQAIWFLAENISHCSRKEILGWFRNWRPDAYNAFVDSSRRLWPPLMQVAMEA
ncbi:MAG: hypothetical protein C0404_01265 [Verrucomicrobia bacterium]|nr:hypothetical protein [Verrucomicrobiota bacterium]